MGTKTRDEAFDGISKKISKNPPEWNEGSGFYETTVNLSKNEKNALLNDYEAFGDDDDSLVGWTISKNGTSFYYDIDDSEDEDDLD